MNKKKLEDYIKKALKLINEAYGSEVPKEINGYIASFGSRIAYGGLLPAVAFYENTSSDSKEDRTKLMKMILNIVDSESKEETLLEYCISNHGKYKLKEDIKLAAIAIKLSVRTFKFSGGEKNE